jgi:hypothetical protein
LLSLEKQSPYAEMNRAKPYEAEFTAILAKFAALA